LCDQNCTILSFEWPNQCKVEERNCSTSRTKKSSDSDQYGLAPFDASKGLTKLTTCIALPSEAEVGNIKPLLARIQVLKSAAGGGLTGIAYGGLSSETHSTATILSIQVVDLLWFDRSFSSVCSGTRGKGSRQEGEIIDYSYCQDGDSCLCISFLRLHAPFATST
jgi:hypothetical protein